MSKRVLHLVVAVWLGLVPPFFIDRAQADLIGSCVFTMSEVAFGQVNLLPGAAINTNGLLSVSCPGLATLVGSTLYACVSFPTTRMIHGSSVNLGYNFYGPLPSTASWSSSTSIQYPTTLLLNGGSASVTIPAALLAGQSTTPPGSYTSTVTATIVFGLLGCNTGTVYNTTVPFQIDATVVSACNVSAQDIGFGSIGFLTSPLDAQGLIAAQCTVGTSYTVQLNGGLNAAATATQRQMMPVSGSAAASGGSAITYGLYQDAARTKPWGNTTGSNVLSSVGTASTQSTTVYARVPIQTNPVPGTYSDTVLVTLVF